MEIKTISQVPAVVNFNFDDVKKSFTRIFRKIQKFNCYRRK